jgi:UDP-N-acetylglucosamine 4,6-dehydratase/5-epimerase
MRYVVIGGTGTLGSTLIKMLLARREMHTQEVICFSRDELKQKKLKAEYPGDKRLKMVLGDIKDRESLRPVMMNADVVFHVAALKHIDSVEENPREGVNTNILGTINVAEIAMETWVPYVVFSSTDKAVEPINVYGMTKAVSERYLLNLNKDQTQTRFSVFRWGNVLGSRGSVIHHFVQSLKDTRSINLTHAQMSRFWIHIDDAVSFMLSNYLNASSSKVMIPKMKGSTVLELAKVTASVMGIQSFEIKDVGMRIGEKLAEVIDTDSEIRVSSDTCPQFTRDELKALVGPMLEGITA